MYETVNFEIPIYITEYITVRTKCLPHLNTLEKCYYTEIQWLKTMYELMRFEVLTVVIIMLLYKCWCHVYLQVDADVLETACLSETSASTSKYTGRQNTWLVQYMNGHCNVKLKEVNHCTKTVYWMRMNSTTT
jgi:hypothetical protein